MDDIFFFAVYAAAVGLVAAVLTGIAAIWLGWSWLLFVILLAVLLAVLWVLDRVLNQS